MFRLIGDAGQYIFSYGKRGALYRGVKLCLYKLLAAQISYLHVALTNLPTTVRAGNSPVYTVIFSVTFEMSSFHGFTTSCTLCVTILATFLVCLPE